MLARAIADHEEEVYIQQGVLPTLKHAREFATGSLGDDFRVSKDGTSQMEWRAGVEEEDMEIAFLEGI